MTAFVTPTRVTALAVPLPVEVWSAESDYTEAGPRAGAVSCTSTGGSALRLAVHGLTLEPGALALRVQAPGFPLRGELALAYQGPADTNWIGADPPNMITDWQEIDDGAGLGTVAGRPWLLSSGGVVVCAFSVQTVGTGTACYVRRLVGNVWGARIAVGIGQASGLLELPDGRILLSAGVVDTGPYADADGMALIYRSEDRGATWELHSRDCRGAGLAYSQGVIKGADSYSDNLGGSFNAGGGPYGAFHAQVALPSGGFLGANLDALATNSGVYLSAGGTVMETAPYELFGSAGGADLEPSGVLALCSAPNGRLFLVAAQDGTGGDGVVYTSASTGKDGTWAGLGKSSMSSVVPIGRWWHPAGGPATLEADGLAACWHQGALIVAARHAGLVRPGALDMLALGGMSTVTLPPVGLSNAYTGAVGWELTWIPWAVPSAMGWTAAGAGSETVTSAGLELVSAVGQSRDYTLAPNGDTPDGLIVLADVAVTAGGSTAALVCGLSLRTADAVYGHEVQIRLSSTQLRVRDVVAGTTLATVDMDGTAYPLITAGARILCALANGSLAIWACDRGSAVRRWALVYLGAVADDAAAGGTANSVVWGHPGAALVVTESAWTQLQVCHNTYTGRGALALGCDVNTLRGFEHHTELPSGHVPIGRAGPGAQGDTFMMASAADYALSQGDLTTEPSARALWRSADNTADQVLAWRIDELGDAYADAADVLYLGGVNWRTGILEVRTGGAWSTLASLDLADGLTGLDYVRRGNTLTVDTSASPPGSRWLDRGELVGGFVDFGGGVVRRIVQQTEGTWSASLTAHRLPILTLADCDGTEPTSGSCALVPAQALIVIRHTDTTRERQGYRLTIGAQDTPDGDIRAKYLWASLVPFGLHPDEAQDRGVSAPLEEVEHQDGTRYRRRLGPVRRSITLAWTDGVLEHWPLSYAALGTAPVMGLMSGAPGASVNGSEARILEALVDELAALSKPVILVRGCPPGPPAVSLSNAAREFMPCTLTGPIVVQEVQGVARGGDAESDGKLTTVGTLELVELV